MFDMKTGENICTCDYYEGQIEGTYDVKANRVLKVHRKDCPCYWSPKSIKKQKKIYTVKNKSVREAIKKAYDHFNSEECDWKDGMDILAQLLGYKIEKVETKPCTVAEIIGRSTKVEFKNPSDGLADRVKKGQF